MKKTLLLFYLCSLSVLFSCNSDNKQEQKSGTAKGASTSAPYELLVVCNKEWLKTSNAEPLKDIMYADIPCLPQSESYFRTTTIDPVNFNRSFMFYANILRAEVGPKYTAPECKVARDVYARPQIIVTLTAPDQASFQTLCQQYKQQILDLFNQAELQREIRHLKNSYSGIVQRQAKQQFQCDLYAPEAINATKTGKDFFWASSEGQHENYLNICMYAYPFSSASTFTLDYFLAKRDSFMRENIQGMNETEYMSTDHRVVQSRDISVNGHYVQEVRGLWQMENAPMGGPFVSYSQLDTLRQRIIVVEGFVYAPGKDKRNFIRELEAALQTLVIH